LTVLHGLGPKEIKVSLVSFIMISELWLFDLSPLE